MLRAVADTHTLIWYLFDDVRLSPSAKAFMERIAADGDQIAFSTITVVEIAYLTEKQRIRPETLYRLSTAVTQEDALFAAVPLDFEIASVLSRVDRAQIPDMPDRIIAATALHLGLPLISRDGRIRVSAVETIW